MVDDESMKSDEVLSRGWLDPGLAAAVQAAESDAVYVEREALTTLELRGADVLAYLHAVTTQHLRERAVGETCSALMLSPKGKVDFVLRVVVLADRILVVTQTEAASALAHRLQRFVFRADVTFGPTWSGGLSLIGPRAEDYATRAGLAWAQSGRAERNGGEPLLVAIGTERGIDVVGPELQPWVAALEAVPVVRGSSTCLEVLRIRDQLPRWGHELADDTLAEEAGVLGSHVHLDKGCYPGQETVARVHNLGQVQRRLVAVSLPDATPDALPPVPIALVTEDGRRAGQVRSVAWDPMHGGCGLALVRRVVAPGALLHGTGADAVMSVRVAVDAPTAPQPVPLQRAAFPAGRAGLRPAPR